METSREISIHYNNGDNRRSNDSTNRCIYGR